MGLIAAIAGAIAEVFKKTLYRTDSKPAGRHVAQDMPEVGGIPLLTKTLLDHGDLHVACAPVTGRTVARKLKSVNWKLHHADA